MWGEGALPSLFFGIDGGFLYMVFFLESGPRAMEPGLVLDLCPVSGPVFVIGRVGTGWTYYI
jgi:hypothetical protein